MSKRVAVRHPLIAGMTRSIPARQVKRWRAAGWLDETGEAPAQGVSQDIEPHAAADKDDD